MVEGYCLKEKKKVQVNDPKYEVNARGQPVIKGTCSSCGGKIYKIIKWDEAPAELQSKRKTGGIVGGNETAGTKKGSAATTARSKSRSSRSAAQKSRGSRSAKSSATQKSRGAQKSRGGRAAAQKSRNKTSSRKSLGTGRSSNSRKARK
jgi:hypothetical protein